MTLRRWLLCSLIALPLAWASPAAALTIVLSQFSSDETPAEVLDATLEISVAGDQLTLTLTNDTTAPDEYDITEIFFNGASNVTGLTLDSATHSAEGDVTDLWIAGTAIADGFAVWEAWLGRHAVRSRTRTTDLPTMTAQTVGAVFTVMDRHEDLWREVRGSEPLPAVGDPVPALTEPTVVDVERMLDGLEILARETRSAGRRRALWRQLEMIIEMAGRAVSSQHDRLAIKERGDRVAERLNEAELFFRRDEDET